MIRLVLTHGVNHDQKARDGYVEEWRRALAPACLELGIAGNEVELIRASWSSIGSFLADGFSGLMSDEVFEGHLAELALGFDGDEGLDKVAWWPKPVVWIAHSWGCVLAHELKVRQPNLDRIPLIACGSPHTHPVIGGSLAVRGRVRRYPRNRGLPPSFLSNRDDKICSLSRWAPTLPLPLMADRRWIDVPDHLRRGSTQEHKPDHYFRVAAFREALVAALLLA